MPSKTPALLTTVSEFRFNWADRAFPIHRRPGTTDDNGIEEVLGKRAYRKPSIGFDVYQDEHWLDLGANIGAFGLYCRFNGAIATCYEPDRECFKLLKANLGGYKGLILCNTAVTTNPGPTLPFYRSADPTNFYRNTEISGQRGKSGPYTQYAEVRNTFIGDLPARDYDGVKMDIEGSELSMLDDMPLFLGMLGDAPKLVMEYHINRDGKNLKNFHKRMKGLKKRFKIVNYAPSIDRMGDRYTGRFDFIVFCINR